MKVNIITTLILLLGYQVLVAQSDNFYDVNTIQDINITFDTDKWSNDLDSLRYNGDGLLLGKVEINGQEFENVGVRYRGSKSFTPGSKRNGLHLKLNYIKKDQNIQGYATVKLSKALRDPSMLREVMSYEIARKYMPAPQANYARVKINGEVYGLFVNVEAVGETFLKNQFGSTENAFFKSNQYAGLNTPAGCKSKIYGSLEHEDNVECLLNNFEKISEDGWDDLIELTKYLNKRTGEVSKVLDVDGTLWMLAFNNVLVNLSSYSGQSSVNYYLYKDDAGQFNPIIWDLNLSFGSFKNTGAGSDLRLRALQELDPLLHSTNGRKPLISKLLNNELYRKTYLSHVRTILTDNFVDGDYEKRAAELQALIKNDFENDPGQRYTATDLENSMTKTIGKRSKIPGIKELMMKRAKFLKKQPSLATLPPSVSAVTVIGRPQFSNTQISTFRITAAVSNFPKRVKLMYRLGSTGVYEEVSMQDDGQNNDGESGDGVFGATVVPQNGEKMIEYYIVAENATLLGYSPSNYMWEVHSSTLEDLNK